MLRNRKGAPEGPISAPPPHATVLGRVTGKDGNVVSLSFETYDHVMKQNVNGIVEFVFAGQSTKRIEMVKVDQHLQVVGRMVSKNRVHADQMQVLEWLGTAGKSTASGSSSPGQKTTWFKFDATKVLEEAEDNNNHAGKGKERVTQTPPTPDASPSKKKKKRSHQ